MKFHVTIDHTGGGDLTPDAMKQIRRRVLGLTQAQMGAVLGVSRETVWRYETGNVKPSGTTQMVYRELADGWRPAVLLDMEET